MPAIVVNVDVNCATRCPDVCGQQTCLVNKRMNVRCEMSSHHGRNTLEQLLGAYEHVAETKHTSHVSVYSHMSDQTNTSVSHTRSNCLPTNQSLICPPSSSVQDVDTSWFLSCRFKNTRTYLEWLQTNKKGTNLIEWYCHVLRTLSILASSSCSAQELSMMLIRKMENFEYVK